MSWASSAIGDKDKALAAVKKGLEPQTYDLPENGEIKKDAADAIEILAKSSAER